MPRTRALFIAVAAAALVAPMLVAAAPPSVAAAVSGTGSYVLAATDRGSGYAPTFTGNGYLSVRVPPVGQGYAGGTVPSLCEVAGFYADPPNDVQQRANLPTWSTLQFGDGTDTFSLDTGSVSGWRQELDLRNGVITTTASWRAPDGNVTDLTYRVFTDRAREHVASVQLRFTPHWNGRARVTDLLDGTPATLTSGVSRDWDPAKGEISETVRTVGTGLVAALASRLATPAAATISRVTPGDSQSIGQQATFGVESGKSYTVTKYVGVATSNETTAPAPVAHSQAAHAAQLGRAALRSENAAAWRRLWAGRIDVQGDPTLATQVNASQFYLWSSTRRDVDWSISPAGLSSNGYNGHIFWDAETWMHPSLLAQHPDLAAAMDAYRFKLLDAARQHARETGWRGARFPWESALDGTEQIPPPVSVNSEGLYEQHITADIALAQWQYFEATGDRGWLRDRGWPVLSGAATFWASRAARSADGSYHLTHVTGPDEENPDVNDEAYTNVAAVTTLRIATRAAHVLGKRAPGAWRDIAAGLVVPLDRQLGIHPEFAGYQGQLVKQADVTMLQYPWRRPMSDEVAQNDLDYYVPRSDPDGPSMSDAINNIDTAALGSPGCASYVYTERSILPFMRDAFDQFSETRNGGAFTFMTGIGGFLQEFLYGYSGLRMSADGVSLDPSLTGQLSGVVLHHITWHGSRFTVAIGDSRTEVTLDSGPAVPVTVHGVTATLSRNHPITVGTRRPDTTPTNDVARCAPAAASSAQPGAVALAAVDGSVATQWQPASVPARLTVPLGAARQISHTTVWWGRMWPPPPGPNIPPPPGPVQTLRPSAYDVLISQNGRDWQTVATVNSTTTRLRDVFNFPAVSARYVAIRIDTAPSNLPEPMLQELTVTH